MAPRVELFHFRFRDPRTGKWTRARYAATREEIAERYAEYEIARPAEARAGKGRRRVHRCDWLNR